MSGLVEGVKGVLGGQPAVAQPAVEKGPYITTNTGIPVFDHHNSETLGRRGKLDVFLSPRKEPIAVTMRGLKKFLADSLKFLLWTHVFLFLQVLFCLKISSLSTKSLNLIVSVSLNGSFTHKAMLQRGISKSPMMFLTSPALIYSLLWESAPP